MDEKEYINEYGNIIPNITKPLLLISEKYQKIRENVFTNKYEYCFCPNCLEYQKNKNEKVEYCDCCNSELLYIKEATLRYLVLVKQSDVKVLKKCLFI